MILMNKMHVQSTDENCIDSVANRSVDIGLPFPRPSRSTELKKRLQHVREQRKSTILEKSSREQKRKYTNPIEKYLTIVVFL
jgi:hypothetical protein